MTSTSQEGSSSMSAQPTFERCKMILMEHLRSPSNQMTPEQIEVLSHHLALFGTQPLDDDRKDVWIILEGLDGCGKSTLTRNLLNVLQSRDQRVRMLRTPPIELASVRPYFDRHSDPALTKTFYQFGNYVAAHAMKLDQDHNIFIIDRFWPSTVAGQEANLISKDPSAKMPDRSSSIYRWPSDLHCPSQSLIFFLHIDEETRKQRLNQRSSDENTVWELQLEKQKYRRDVTEAYSNIEGIIKIDASPSADEVCKMVTDIVSQSPH
eukprot:TRINITY_DN7014_c0_g1_i1.p1 TRINITY_DN7014_c0_g1~~TRINITY_DN7014_c0_g1_i1.p1  ORF type:complete len:265 (-),score=70.02 TRINITY_DN7014_c0_g1_i1:197-991(-)